MRTFIPTLHTIETEQGTIKVVEQPLERVYDDVYPGVFTASRNTLWRVRYSLFEAGDDESYRSCTLVVPCGQGYLSGPHENTLKAMLEDADRSHCSTPEEEADSSGADFTVDEWKEIFKVWEGWDAALGEFFGKYYRDVQYEDL